MMRYSIYKAFVMMLSNIRIYLLVIAELACMEGVLVMCDAMQRSAGSEVERLSEIYRDQDIYITYYPANETVRIPEADGEAGITYADYEALRNNVSEDVTLQYYLCDMLTLYDEGGFRTIFIVWGSETFFQKQLGKEFPASGRPAGYIGQNAADLLARQTAMLIPDPGQEMGMGDSPGAVTIEGTEYQLERLDKEGWIPASGINIEIEIPYSILLPIERRPEHWVQTNARTVLSAGFADFRNAPEQVSEMISLLFGRHEGQFIYRYNDVLSEYMDHVDDVMEDISFFSFIAKICLCVAFFGITGIMTLAVRKRKKEYAVSYAVGARRRNIYMELLSEILIVSAAGGVLGALIGFCLTLWQTQSAFRVRFYPASLSAPVLLTLLIPLLTGLAVLPDVNAVNPMETIRSN